MAFGSYRTTLNAMAVTEDEDEQNKVLRACHKRCAERALKAMEKNGGIFIKLGQHLVRKQTFIVIRNDAAGFDTNGGTFTERHELSATLGVDYDVYSLAR